MCCMNFNKYYKLHYKRVLHLTFQPSIDISITTPMNWVNRIMGVRNDHTGQSAILKLWGTK